MKFFIIFLASMIAFVVYVRLLEQKLLFAPSAEITFTPQSFGIDYEDVYFQTSDGVHLHGWFVPATNEKQEQTLTVFFCHGNGGNISDRVGNIKVFHELGWNVFIFDYRGYGKSEGRPSEQGLYKDAKSAYDHLINEKKIDPETIIGYGASLGGAVMIELSTHIYFPAMIINSTFTNVESMANYVVPWVPKFLIQSKFDSYTKIQKKKKQPTLVLHSEEDELIPFDEGVALFEMMSFYPKEFLQIRGGHNTGFFDVNPNLVNDLKVFVEQYLKY